jgi:hypothetical protein
MAGKKRLSPAGQMWVVVLAICVALVSWGLVHWTFVRDAPRSWSYGTLPDLPGESAYSSEGMPFDKAVPIQVHPLPEAVTNRTDHGGGRLERRLP